MASWRQSSATSRFGRGPCQARHRCGSAQPHLSARSGPTEAEVSTRFGSAAVRAQVNGTCPGPWHSSWPVLTLCSSLLLGKRCVAESGVLLAPLPCPTALQPPQHPCAKALSALGLPSDPPVLQSRARAGEQLGAPAYPRGDATLRSLKVPSSQKQPSHQTHQQWKPMLEMRHVEREGCCSLLESQETWSWVPPASDNWGLCRAGCEKRWKQVLWAGIQGRVKCR